MRISKVRLKQFKRFDDLTIDLGDHPKKIIALVGPNGCGKSSIFDAFEEKQKDYKGASRNPLPSYFLKAWFSILAGIKSETYQRSNAINIYRDDGTSNFDTKSFYIRTAYRFTPNINVSTIRSLPDPVADTNRPGSSVDLDSRLQENYERLLGKAWKEYQQGTKSGPKMRQELVGQINNILEKIVDIRISNLGDIIAGKGQLYFEKESSRDFPYENLSSGEKEVVDIIIDLVVKIPDFNETIYCIDEPELHLNTSIQRTLLKEIEKLIPDNCQLWVATHSIGFLRAIQEDLKEKSQILNFSEQDYFNGEKTIKPMKTTRKNWQQVFQTALEDLTGLLAPNRIIYCEGRAEPAINGAELGLDADIYNEIFSEEHHDTLFISSGGGGATEKNTSIALKVLSKAFVNVELFLLRDRDSISDSDRQSFLDSDQSHRMLIRREIENYIYDKEILLQYCNSKSITFDEAKYNSVVTDINKQDLKPIQQTIQASCGSSGSIEDFKRKLATFILPDTQIYKDLSSIIFN